MPRGVSVAFAAATAAAQPPSLQMAMPGATVMEVRGGKVVRITLYYDNAVIGLQE